MSDQAFRSGKTPWCHGRVSLHPPSRREHAHASMHLGVRMWRGKGFKPPFNFAFVSLSLLSASNVISKVLLYADKCTQEKRDHGIFRILFQFNRVESSEKTKNIVTSYQSSHFAFSYGIP